MEKTYVLYADDVKSIIADMFNAEIENVSVPNQLQIRVVISEEKIEQKPQAYWKYWGGWGGNHDKRIDDATCSNCGFKHPTVRGYDAPNQLHKICPRCGLRMGHREV